MAPPRTHDEALRVILLDRASELVSAQGPDALVLRTLAADAGTSTTAVYSLFGNKAGLLNELYREAERQFAATLATVAPTEDAAADVLHIGLAYRAYALTHPHLYTIMFDRRIDRPAAEPGCDQTGSTFRLLVDAVARGQANGQFRATRPEQIALSCWGIAHGMVQLELSGRYPCGIDEAIGYTEALATMIDGWRQPRG